MDMRGKPPRTGPLTEIATLAQAPGGPARLIAMHGAYYGREWGLGAFFRDKVAADLEAFLADQPHPGCGLWFARRAQAIVGSIAIDGREGAARGAHLRWFIVDDAVRGGGGGRLLLDHALAFCAACGFDRVHLWTFAGLDAARRLYESRGFRLTDQSEAETWGVRLVEQRFALHRTGGAA